MAIGRDEASLPRTGQHGCSVWVVCVEPSTSEPKLTEREGLRFYGPDDDELPPGAVEALERRTPEELQAAADRATRGS